jgi:nucleoid-associated protein YgaU
MKKKLIIGVLVLCNMVLMVGSVFATKLGNVNNTSVLKEDELYSLKMQETALSQKAASLEDSQIIENSQIAEELKFEETPVNIDKSQMAEKVLYVEEEEALPVDDQQVSLPVNEQQVASVDISTKTIYKVKPNDSLSKIANEYFGDETKWDKIFQANKDNLSDPNSLYVGQELLIPEVSVEKAEAQAFRAAPVEKKPKHDIAVNAITHTVQSGDSLYKVSGKYYHDPTMWRKIYEANEETLEGQDLLRKGQILIIPQ